MRVAVLAVAALMAVGCHTYEPLVGVTPANGMRIRLQLTDSGSATLSGYIGPQVVEISGRVRSADDRAITLSVSAIKARDGSEPFWKGEPVTIPRSLIARAEEERLAKGRTAGAAGASLALAVVIARSFGLGGATDRAPSGGGGSPR